MEPALSKVATACVRAGGFEEDRCTIVAARSDAVRLPTHAIVCELADRHGRRACCRRCARSSQRTAAKDATIIPCSAYVEAALFEDASLAKRRGRTTTAGSGAGAARRVRRRGWVRKAAHALRARPRSELEPAGARRACRREGDLQVQKRVGWMSATAGAWTWASAAFPMRTRTTSRTTGGRWPSLWTRPSPSAPACPSP